METNPFIKLKIPGVIGTIPEHYRNISLYDNAGESISIYVGMLAQDAYDFGWLVYIPDGTRNERLPGQGSGYFKTEIDALRFGSYALRSIFYKKLSDQAKNILDSYIRSLSQPSLFDEI